MPLRTVTQLFSALFIICAILSLGMAAAEEEAEATQETPLEARAKILLRSYPQAKTEAERTVMRESLLAKADSLEADSSDVLASHCLERAGMIGYYLGEYDRAGDVWARGLEVAHRSGDKNRIAALLNARAVGFSAQGDNAQAIILQGELLELRRELGDIRGEAVTWHNMAYSYRALYRYPEAIIALENAVRGHREAGNAYGLAVSMSILSATLAEMGRPADAIVLADSAVAASDRVEQPQLIGIALGNRALQHQTAGRHEAAIADLDRAKEVLANSGLTRQIAVNRVNRAGTLNLLGRCEEALGEIRLALPVIEEGGTPADQSTAGAIEARALIECGETEQGRAMLLAAIAKLDAARDSLDSDLARAEALRAGGWAYADLASLYATENRHEEAWFALESGAASLWRARMKLPSGASKQDLAKLQTLLGEIDAVLIQYAHITEHGVACTITPTSVTVRRFDLPTGLSDTIAQSLRVMAAGASDDQCAPLLATIGDALLAPVANVLTGSTTRVIVCAAQYSGVPFEALPLPGTDGVSLGERCAVTYAPSVSAFLHLEEQPVDSESFVVFADPVGEIAEPPHMAIATRSSRMSRLPLPEAREEARAIATRSATTLIGDDARKPEFFERAPGAGIIHFATHAVVDGGHPSSSFIILAGAEESDATLTAGEIEALELAVDLVTLSGCKTAGGYVVPGEGALGLASAFHVAGARSVVASRWDVEDAAARRFMEIFYGELKEGVARDVAMQTAQQTMAAEGFPYRDHAAFALTGVAGQPVAAAMAGGSPTASMVAIYGGIATIFIVLMAARARRRKRA